MGTAPVVCPSAPLRCPPSAPLWGRSAAGGAAARGAGGLLFGGGSPGGSCPLLPCTFVNYPCKLPNVNGCWRLRLYSLPGAPCGRCCRKVVRQWDFAHCVRKSTRVGVCAGVFVCQRGWGSPGRSWLPAPPAPVPQPCPHSPPLLPQGPVLGGSPRPLCCPVPAPLWGRSAAGAAAARGVGGSRARGLINPAVVGGVILRAATPEAGRRG